MFTGFTQRTIDFMWNLRLNNNRDWFLEHKQNFTDDFQTPMKELGSEVFEGVKKKCGDRTFIHKVSRIYKDARRVRNGEPYRDHLWFSIERASEEWTATPVFWFEIGPESYSYGLGYYQARPITMQKFRARLDSDPKKFEKLIASLAKRDKFDLTGEEYKRKKEAPTPKTADWYNKKSFSIICRKPLGEELFLPDFKDVIIDDISFLMPIYDYLITLDGDPDPNDK